MIEQAVLSLEPLGDSQVVRLQGRESMNELTTFTIEALSADASVDPASLVDQPAILGIDDAAGQETRFHLIVVRARHLGHFRSQERVGLELSSPFARLALRVNHAIYQDKTTQEIAALLLEKAGFPSSVVHFRLAGQYAKRVYTVQYGESDWAFLSRLMADEGINYWFDLSGEETWLIFGDHPTSHDSVEGDSGFVPFQDASGMLKSSLGFHALKRSWSICSTNASLLDIDLQNPAVPVEAAAGEGDLEVFEYPSNLVVPEAAEARAKVRLSQLRRHRTTLSAESGTARIRSGRVAQIQGAADDCFSGKFLITSVEHRLSQATQNDARGASYSNSVSLVPFTETEAYRPAPPSKAGGPRIEGLESAIVTGPAGEEIHVDDLGRIKVRFLWDRSGVGDDKSSRWVRTLQMNLEAPQMLPRVGWEVPVIYENGDPDRPFVLGRLYNGGAPPPYGQPGKKATSTLQSATSPGGGGTQEIRFGDDAGSEETFIHATKDQTVSVGGSHLVDVAANRSDDVQKTQTLGIDSAQTISVGGNQKITVGANGLVAVKGARAESIGGNETVGVTGTYALVVKGSYTELVGGFYSLRCNQSNATIQGAFTQAIGAALSTTAGLGASQSVAGARTEVVGGARSFTAGSAYTDKTTGAKRITAGAASETADANLAFTAGARAQIQAGAAISIEGGAKVVFEGATISVKAASLTAKGGSTMKLSGSLKSSATVKLDAPSVKKTKKQKVEG